MLTSRRIMEKHTHGVTDVVRGNAFAKRSIYLIISKE